MVRFQCTSTVLLVVVLFLHHTWLGAAQQMMPFPGQGEEPGEATTVFVSTYIDRLMYIDDKNYEFQVGADAPSAMPLSWPAMLSQDISNWCSLNLNEDYICNQVLIAHRKAVQQGVIGPGTSMAPGRAQSAEVGSSRCMHASIPWYDTHFKQPSFAQYRTRDHCNCLVMQAMVFVYLSWTDPRARKAVAANAARLKANSSETCKFQCQLYPKDQPNPTQGCCDNVWVSV
jgi:hypothetical protein